MMNTEPLLREDLDIKLGIFEVTCGQGVSVKGICKTHPRCSLFLWAEKDYYMKVKEVLRFVKDGPFKSAAEHAADANACKVRLGVRLRRKK